MRFIARRAGVDIPVEVERAGNGYRVKIGDRWMDADLVDAGPYLRSLRLEDGTQFSFAHHREGITHEISMQAATVHVDIIDPLSLKRRRREDETGGAGIVKALMPGRIVRILVAPGADGVVDEIFVKPGDTVEVGADLAHVGAGS